MNFAVRWTETAGRNMRLVTKEKEFETEAERDKHVVQLEGKENFVEILAWRG